MSEAVRKLSADEITAEAERHIDDYLDSGYDLEAKDIQAAVEAGVDPKAVAAIWAHAKTLRPGKPKAELFICPTPQPGVEESKVWPPSDMRARFNKAQPAPANDFAAERARREKALAAKPKAEAEPEPDEIPEPEVEPEVEPKPEAGRFGGLNPPNLGEGAAVLSPNAPYDTAKEFTRRHCQLDGRLIVYFWQSQFWRWNGKFYAEEQDEVIRGQLYAFLDGASKWTGQHQTVRFQPTPRHVSEVLDCLKTGLALGVECQPPMWLDTRKSATEMIVFRNGVVNVLTGEKIDLTPRLWVHSALGFDWNPKAPCRAWEKFLQEVFPDDKESEQFLEEWMGYCMTEETKFQKGAMLIGPKRSGRGTISHVLRQMVGDGSYAGLSFNTWTSGENSREVLIKKRVGVFADVRFKPGRAYGQSYDPGGISHISAELLLNITGEDTLTIARKWKAAWHGQLRLKIMLISNEVPNLNDPSGVLPSRFVKVRFGVSFYGREDVNLRSRLEGELSGIAARCVAAYQRLCATGKFIQPASAQVLELDVLAESDPFTAMAMECFEPEAESSVIKIVAYNWFEEWCRENGRIDVLRTTPNNKFGKRLKAVPGFERVCTDKRVHGKPRAWLGIKLKRR